MQQKNCTYHGCNLPINSPYDDMFCLGHASIEKKGVDEIAFNNFLSENKFHNGDYKFTGFIFPYIFNPFLINQTVGDKVEFYDCEFHGKAKIQKNNEHAIYVCVELSKLKFLHPIIFDSCKFLHGLNLQNDRLIDLNFNNCEIKGIVFLNNTEILNDLKFCDSTIWKEFNAPKLSINGILKLENSKFHNSLILNDSICKSVYINNANFGGDSLFCRSEIKASFTIENSKFLRNSTFSNCKFNGDVDLLEVMFESDADFSNSMFDKDLYFDNTQFSIVRFTEAEFKASTSFDKTKFNNWVFFENAIFHSNLFFKEAEFVRLTKSSTEKDNSKVLFENTIFDSHVSFIDSLVNQHLVFDNFSQTKKTSFYFINPTFNTEGLVAFKNVQFEPFTTYFENIKRKHNSTPLFIFRYCNLKDVYFSNNNLSYFSFYKCAFDEARFFLSSWDYLIEKRFFTFPYKRRNIIFEDRLYIQSSNVSDNIFKNELTKFEIGEFLDHGEIANLYRRFKTSLDKTKDYEQAGWFYFNELEMKRRECFGYVNNEESFKTIKKLWRSKNKKRLTLYSFYKTFAGYGEKPLWSLTWLIFFIILFTIINLLTGLNFADGHSINYDISLTIDGVKTLFSQNLFFDLISSFIYTIYRIVPISYLPIPKEQYTPQGLDGLLISFLTTITLLLFATLIGIGLKRIFRRF